MPGTRASGWAPLLAWPCPSGTTDTPFDNDSSSLDVLRNWSSAMTVVPATRLYAELGLLSHEQEPRVDIE
jgi:hypothetical protein